MPLKWSRSFKLRKHYEPSIYFSEPVTNSSLWAGSEFYSGSPLITEHTYGKGSASYLAARFEMLVLLDYYTNLNCRAGVQVGW